MASSNADHLPPRASSPSRRGSSSTQRSEPYHPIPPGRWILDIHGNCSKCHHHHGSARVHVNVPNDNKNLNITHVRCQRCHEKWLAIGGRNQTQLSLLSINSIAPDPVAVSVQHSLAEMVRLATAIASPSHSLVPVTAASPSPPVPFGQQSFRAPPLSSTQLDVSPRGQPRDTEYLNGFVGPTQPRTPIQTSAVSMAQSSSSQRYGIHTSRHFSNLRETLALRFPGLHRANLSRRLSIMRQPRASVNHTEYHPVIPNVNEDRTVPANSMSGATQAEHGDIERPQERSEQHPESPSRRSTLSDTAAQFLAALANDTTDLGALNQKERAAWVREKYTEFRNQNVRAEDHQHNTTPIPRPYDIDSIADTLHHVEANLQSRQFRDLRGLGSQYGHVDSLRLERTSTISINTEASQAEAMLSDIGTVAIGSRQDRVSTISTSTRTSQATTLVNESNAFVAPSSPRFSWNEHVRRERPGSPRPPSINLQTLQRLRYSGEIRY